MSTGGDMRIEVVKRELNQGALAGFESSVTDYAAKLVVSALDTYDEHAIAEAFRRGFELGEQNQRLLAEAERDALAARLERAERVVEVALRWRRLYATDLDKETAFLAPRQRALLEAVDAYRAGEANGG